MNVVCKWFFKRFEKGNVIPKNCDLCVVTPIKWAFVVNVNLFTVHLGQYDLCSTGNSWFINLLQQWKNVACAKRCSTKSPDIEWLFDLVSNWCKGFIQMFNLNVCILVVGNSMLSKVSGWVLGILDVLRMNNSFSFYIIQGYCVWQTKEFFFSCYQQGVKFLQCHLKGVETSMHCGYFTV